jgi:hypothetical protein
MAQVGDFGYGADPVQLLGYVNTYYPNTVQFESYNPSVVSITDGVMSITGVGSATIRAYVSEDDYYLGYELTQIVNVYQSGQSIDFTLASPLYVGQSVQLSATSTSGLPVTGLAPIIQLGALMKIMCLPFTMLASFRYMQCRAEMSIMYTQTPGAM